MKITKKKKKKHMPTIHHKPDRRSSLFWFLRGAASGQGFAFAKGAGDSALEEGPLPRAWDPLFFLCRGEFPHVRSKSGTKRVYSVKLSKQ